MAAPALSGAVPCSLPGGNRGTGVVPIKNAMHSFDYTPEPEPPAEQLLRDCLALGTPGLLRPPALVRLEEALGPELTRRLLASLTVGSRG